jgi:hypothetical protein
MWKVHRFRALGRSRLSLARDRVPTVRRDGRGGIMMGMPTQPFRAGLRLAGGPPGLEGLSLEMQSSSRLKPVASRNKNVPRAFYETAVEFKGFLLFFYS